MPRHRWMPMIYFNFFSLAFKLCILEYVIWDVKIFLATQEKNMISFHSIDIEVFCMNDTIYDRRHTILLADKEHPEITCFFSRSNTAQPNDENQFISLFSTPLFLFLSRISKHRLLKINLWINRIFKATKYVSSLYCFFRFTTFAFENFLFHILI